MGYTVTVKKIIETHYLDDELVAQAYAKDLGNKFPDCYIVIEKVKRNDFGKE